MSSERFFDQVPRFAGERPPGLENHPVTTKVLGFLRGVFEPEEPFTFTEAHQSLQETLEKEGIGTSRSALAAHMIILVDAGYCSKERIGKGPGRKAVYQLNPTYDDNSVENC